MARICLCLNQVARLRAMNRSKEPDPVAVAIAAEIAGIDGVIVHLKEDRSDIVDRDVAVLKEVVQTHLNVAIPLQQDLLKRTIQLLPDMVTLCAPSSSEPAASQALNVVDHLEYLEDVVAELRANTIVVSALIEPDVAQIKAAARAGMDYVQIDTAILSQVQDLGVLHDQIERIRSVAMAANKLGLGVSVGRSLSFQTIRELCDIPYIEEYNIGKAAIARSILLGIDRTIESLKNIKP
ncbi:pyridoxine 5'-phosphate synthase [candidate division KSB1 bacterium]|nr:pyridoxine 5'-phosphate synthase [candidate division KSB1 bacterium]